jgi:hypothetical protein
MPLSVTIHDGLMVWWQIGVYGWVANDIVHGVEMLGDAAFVHLCDMQDLDIRYLTECVEFIVEEFDCS